MHGLEREDSSSELCFLLFPLKINYPVVYPYAGCHSGQQTALLPLLPTPPACPVPSPVAAICRCVCRRLLHMTHGGAGTCCAPHANGAVATEALPSDKQQIDSSLPLALRWGRHLYQGPGRRWHDPEGETSHRKANPLSPCHAGECLRVLSFPWPLSSWLSPRACPLKGCSETQGKECRLPPIVSSLRG